MDKLLNVPVTSDIVTDPLKDEMDHVGWKDFYQITKPGIIISNLITALAGFWIAAKWNIDWVVLLLMLVGTTMVMASSCVINNYWDRDLDKRMARTETRALPSGRLKPSVVLWYGLVLGAVGLSALGAINLLSFVLGVIGMFVYAVIYTMWLKRTSTLSTVVGAISGAMPPVIGYCAVTGSMDLGAWLIFAILFLWQPPHFWALSIRRMEEYRAAGYQVLPVVKGAKRTKIHMIPYLIGLFPVTYLLYHFNYVGMYYLVIALVLLATWTYISLSGFLAKDDNAWAKKSFIYSIYYLTFSSIVMILNTPWTG